MSGLGVIMLLSAILAAGAVGAILGMWEVRAKRYDPNKKR